jgi:hypothetical protein
VKLEVEPNRSAQSDVRSAPEDNHAGEGKAENPEGTIEDESRRVKRAEQASRSNDNQSRCQNGDEKSHLTPHGNDYELVSIEWEVPISTSLPGHKGLATVKSHDVEQP